MLLGNKKSLAIPRRQNKLDRLVQKKQFPIHLNQHREPSAQKISASRVDANIVKNQKTKIKSFQQKFKNKNLHSLPASLLVTFSSLTTLDISYNKLNQSQIELVINSCIKLNTLCIQGNIYSLVPASIWKLKELVNFKHDWLGLLGPTSNSLSYENQFESEDRLKKIKIIVQKPEAVVKVNRVVGLNFQNYCHYILNTDLDLSMLNKIKKNEFISQFAKKNITDCIEGHLFSKQKSVQKLIYEKQQHLAACTNMCGMQVMTKKGQNRSLLKKQSISTKDFSEAETQACSHRIKIQDIRDITPNQSVEDLSQKFIAYRSPDFPLHELFANFDRNVIGPSEIDGLLIKGYNPNIYDNHGLSPYHVCIVERQSKGLQYLINISTNNPGFFDLQMISQKQGHNLLHLSVFLKNYQFAKMLLEFGLPIDRRDYAGCRIVHLIDQNYEFLVLMRKLIKNRNKISKVPNSLAVQNIMKKKYIKHPLRLQEQSKIKVFGNKNTKLLQQFESAVGFGNQFSF